MIQTLLAKLLTAKVAAAAAGITLAGGVAVAAGTGAIPNPLRDPAPAEQPASDVTPAPVPSEALVGLCTAYQSGATDNPGAAASTPAFRALAAAAGGDDNIGEFCAELLASAPGSDAPGARPSVLPTPSHPNGPVPTPSHPTGDGTPSHPGGPGATPTHPTGPPNPGRG